MITKNKKYCSLIFASFISATFTTSSFAIDNAQQIAAVSQEIQALQQKLSAANNKIEQLSDCITTKNTMSQESKKNVHRTANGHGR